jgi:hypothetical protein
MDTIRQVVQTINTSCTKMLFVLEYVILITLENLVKKCSLMYYYLIDLEFYL